MSGASGPASARTRRTAEEQMSQTPYRYTADLAGTIETAWQERWSAERTFEAPNPAGPWAEPDRVKGREKLYVMDMFPYPSGTGLHVGHPLGYIATDVYARYQRMRGRNVLHCLGYDAFGLPAEQYAVQTGQHPRATTEANIANMRRQLRRLGLGHDERRSIATTDVPFYRWTQWIFLQLFNAWFDETADNGRGRARHIDELIAAYDCGQRRPEDGSDWAELSQRQRRHVVDGSRLAYLSQAPVNWCPGLGTVLANEEVTADGRSDIGNFPVFKRSMRQWMMRITTYADRLIDDLDRLDWPEPVKLMQRNWIGRSSGARVRFAASGASSADTAAPEQIEVFTTRPDTLFGATFMVLAPEHPLVNVLTCDGAWPEGTRAAWTGGYGSPREAVAGYRAAASGRTDIERQAEGREKTGVFIGAFALNPVNDKAVPIFVADYVLMGYGTGAIMAVPAEDQRDWDFAMKFDLDIIRTVQPDDDHDLNTAYTGDGLSINSAHDELSLNGLGKDEAKAVITQWLATKGSGDAAITYKLRDWLFSRQRYWGEPFPIVYDETGMPVALPESMLPVELPEVADYSPAQLDPDNAASEPVPPLAKAADWVEVELDLGHGPRRYRRELNVMPQWAGSCWYELRYLDPSNEDALVDRDVERYWMGPRDDLPVGKGDPGGVDLYVGGVEHAVLHLLYSRFWHKVLYDLGHVSSEEPFRRLYNQGYIQAHAFRDARGQAVPAAEVEEVAPVSAGGEPSFSWQGQPVRREYGKMGKSLKNIMTPDEMYEQYGADTFRVYEMSMGPLDLSRPWETRAVVGAQRFLQRLWRLIVDEESGQLRVAQASMDEETRRLLHRTIDGVGSDYENLRFNTAVAKLIELTNGLTKLESTPREAAEALVVMAAPVAPHLAEELWSRLGHDQTLTYESFPAADPALLVEDTVTCVVQVQGKVRDRLQVCADILDADLKAAALDSDRIRSCLEGKTIRTVIVRAPGLVNIVVG